MKRCLIFLLFCSSLLAGCSRTARLYPVQGTLSSQTPLPVYIAKLSGGINSGALTATLDNGDVYQGRWRAIPRPKVTKGQASAIDPSTNTMSAEWDAVYGSGYYVAHVLGTSLYARAELQAAGGKVLHVEMYRPVGGGNEAAGEIKGVAKDDSGNIFKVVF